jgi:hypothetical protein
LSRGTSIDVVLVGRQAVHSAQDLVVDQVLFPECNHVMQCFAIRWGSDEEHKILNVDKFDSGIFNETVEVLAKGLEWDTIREWDDIIKSSIAVSSPRVKPGRALLWWDESLLV